MDTLSDWAAILAAAKRPASFAVQALGGQAVFMAPLTIADALEIDRMPTDERTPEAFGAWLIARSLRDADGNALATEDDVRALPQPVFGELFALAAQLNRLIPTGETADVEGEFGGEAASASTSPSDSVSRSEKASRKS
jgi:hypothetical protein